MKLFSTLLLLLICNLAFAQSPSSQPGIPGQPRPVQNVRIEGSLAATQDLQCISLSDANSTQTPADLYTGISKCVNQKEFNKAARLFLMTGMYARFDAERVLDVTARSGGQVLMMRTSNNYSAEQKEEFNKALQQLINNQVELKSACAEVIRIGLPKYFPKYLILHGMNAFTSPNPLENALNPSFDGDAVWSKLVDNYARCPK